MIRRYIIEIETNADKQEHCDSVDKTVAREIYLQFGTRARTWVDESDNQRVPTPSNFRLIEESDR